VIAEVLALVRQPPSSGSRLIVIFGQEVIRQIEIYVEPAECNRPRSYRNHRRGFLRLSVAKSRSRIEALGIKSEQVDRFVNALWFNPELNTGSAASVSGRWN